MASKGEGSSWRSLMIEWVGFELVAPWEIKLQQAVATSGPL
jgi:hypothetical protein